MTKWMWCVFQTIATMQTHGPFLYLTPSTHTPIHTHSPKQKHTSNLHPSPYTEFTNVNDVDVHRFTLYSKTICIHNLLFAILSVSRQLGRRKCCCCRCRWRGCCCSPVKFNCTLNPKMGNDTTIKMWEKLSARRELEQHVYSLEWLGGCARWIPALTQIIPFHSLLLPFWLSISPTHDPFRLPLLHTRHTQFRWRAIKTQSKKKK